MEKQKFDIPETPKDEAAEAAEKRKANEGLTEEEQRKKAEADKAAEEAADRKKKQAFLDAEQHQLEEQMYQYLTKKATQYGVSVEAFLKSNMFTPAQRRVAYEMYLSYKRDHAL